MAPSMRNAAFVKCPVGYPGASELLKMYTPAQRQYFSAQ